MGNPQDHIADTLPRILFYYNIRIVICSQLFELPALPAPLWA